MSPRRILFSLSFAVIGLLLFGVVSSPAQEFRGSVGGGWSIPTNNVEAAGPSGLNVAPLAIDLKPGPHVYAAVGFVRSIGEQAALGGRIRAQVSRFRSTVESCSGSTECSDPNGRLRAATLEGRIILTSPSWIEPYFLVGLGVVHTSVESVTLQGVQNVNSPATISYEEVSVTDAGGDIGLGAAFPLVGGLSADAEFRVTGALPGGKENAVTTLPFSLGLAYSFN